MVFSIKMDELRSVYVLKFVPKAVDRFDNKAVKHGLDFKPIIRKTIVQITNYNHTLYVNLTLKIMSRIP